MVDKNLHSFSTLSKGPFSPFVWLNNGADGHKKSQSGLLMLGLQRTINLCDQRSQLLKSSPHFQKTPHPLPMLAKQI